MTLCCSSLGDGTLGGTPCHSICVGPQNRGTHLQTPEASRKAQSCTGEEAGPVPCRLLLERVTHRGQTRGETEGRRCSGAPMSRDRTGGVSVHFPGSGCTPRRKEMHLCPLSARRQCPYSMKGRNRFPWEIKPAILVSLQENMQLKFHF